MNMRTDITIDLNGNLERKARTYARSITRMSTISRRHLSMLNTTAGKVGRGLDKLANRYTATAAAAGLTMASKQIIDLERRFTRLGIQAGRGAEEMDALKRKIYEVASASDISIDPSEIISALEEITSQVGNLSLGEDNIRNLALAIQAAGAAGRDTGALLANFFEKFGIKTRKDVLATFDLIINQGKAGSLTFANLATQANRVTAAYASMGRTGLEAVKEMGAVLQVVRKGVSGPEQAATAFEAYINTLNDAKKRKLITAKGIKLIDPNDPNRMRSLVDITKDLVKATGGDISKLGTIFDSEARRALLAVATEFKQTHSFDSLDRFVKAQSDGATIMRDSARAAHDAAGAMQNLYTAWQAFADSKLTEPIQDLADVLNKLGSSNVIEAAADVASAAGAAVVGRKIYKAGNVGGIAAGAAEAAAGGLGQALGQRPGKSTWSTLLKDISKVGKSTLRSPSALGVVGAVGLSAYELGSAIEKAFIGGRMGEWLYEATHPKVDLNISIDNAGRARVDSIKQKDRRGDITIDSGPTMVIP